MGATHSVFGWNSCQTQPKTAVWSSDIRDLRLFDGVWVAHVALFDLG